MNVLVHVNVNVPEPGAVKLSCHGVKEGTGRPPGLGGSRVRSRSRLRARSRLLNVPETGGVNISCHTVKEVCGGHRG